jgi:hypothetical protein
MSFQSAGVCNAIKEELLATKLTVVPLCPIGVECRVGSHPSPQQTGKELSPQFLIIFFLFIFYHTSIFN